jgi:hypothetical protein
MLGEHPKKLDALQALQYDYDKVREEGIEALKFDYERQVNEAS